MTAAVTTEAKPGRGGRPRDPSRDTAIRAAVLTLLAEKGYHGMSMDDVASEANAGKATIYRRWATKPAVVAEVVSGVPTPSAVDTGDLSGDLTALLTAFGTMATGPEGRAVRGLLSVAPTEPGIAEVVERLLAAWREAVVAVWARSLDDVPERSRVLGEFTLAPLTQRWLLGESITSQFVANVVTAMLRVAKVGA